MGIWTLLILHWLSWHHLAYQNGHEIKKTLVIFTSLGIKASMNRKELCCRKNVTEFRPFPPFFPTKGYYVIVLTDPEEHRSCSGHKLWLLCQEEDAQGHNSLSHKAGPWVSPLGLKMSQYLSKSVPWCFNFHSGHWPLEMQQCQSPNQHQNEHWASSVLFPGSCFASQTTLLASVRQKCNFKRVKKKGWMWDFSLEPGRVHLWCPDMVTATQTQTTSLCEFARKMTLLFSNEVSKWDSDSHSGKWYKHSIQEQSKIHQMVFFFNWEGRLTSFHWMHVYTDQCQLLFICYF